MILSFVLSSLADRETINQSYRNDVTGADHEVDRECQHKPQEKTE